MGVILLSASKRSIRFSRSINSRLSAFSANMSVPSKCEDRLTCRDMRLHSNRPNDHDPVQVMVIHTDLHHVIQAIEDVLSGLFGLDSHLHLMLCWSLESNPTKSSLFELESQYLGLLNKLKAQCITVVITSLVYNHLEPPEWITGIGSSIKEANSLCSCTQQILSRQALSLRDVTDLEEKRNHNCDL